MSVHIKSKKEIEKEERRGNGREHAGSNAEAVRLVRIIIR